MPNQSMFSGTPFGTRRVHYSLVDSTNERMRAFVDARPVEGSVVTADAQSGGRGRHGRTWHSEPGSNLLVSMILFPTQTVDSWGALPLLAGIAVYDVVRHIAERDPELKWPNDVLFGTKKLAGILVESGTGREPWCIIGIGLNINQTRFPDDLTGAATSLAVETGRRLDREPVLDTLCTELSRRYLEWQARGNEAVADEWKRRTHMLGSEIALVRDGRNRVTVRAVDVLPDGRLLVTRSGVEEAVSTGDVVLPAR